jgi:hypothetical protein
MSLFQNKFPTTNEKNDYDRILEEVYKNSLKERELIEEQREVLERQEEILQKKEEFLRKMEIHRSPSMKTRRRGNSTRNHSPLNPNVQKKTETNRKHAEEIANGLGFKKGGRRTVYRKRV